MGREREKKLAFFTMWGKKKKCFPKKSTRTRFLWRQSFFFYIASAATEKRVFLFIVPVYFYVYMKIGGYNTVLQCI